MGGITYKCPACDAKLKFDRAKQSWRCEYCRNEYSDILINKKQKPAEEREKEDIKNLDSYKCLSCDATLIALDNTKASVCPYCKSKEIKLEKLKEDFNPDYLLPFKYKKEDAINILKRINKRRILLPNVFKKSKIACEMVGLYVPVFLYDVDTSSNLDAKCIKQKKFRDNKFIYTKSDIYNVKRRSDINFKSLLIDDLSKLDTGVLDLLKPFNYSKLKQFNYSYLSGFFAEKYDMNLLEMSKIVSSKVENMTEDILKEDLKEYNSICINDFNVNLLKSEVKCCLLPVWLLNIKYKNKIYRFAMNGQTGSLVSDYRISKKKLVLLWGVIVLLVFLVAWLLFLVGVI